MVVLAFFLWMLGITVWNGLVRLGKIPFLWLESDLPQWLQEKDIRIRTFLTYLFGPVAIIACMAILEKLPQHPPLDRLMHRCATSVLVFADFAHDRTCSVSSATRWVAPLKDRKEQDSPKVLIADLSTWPDIQFSFGACK
jgi:hypothetical protein